MSEWQAEVVARAVEALPEGTAATYGDVAAELGMGARQVGRSMSTYGGGLPWWRVTRSDGRLPAHLLPEARQSWLAEGIPIRADGSGIRLAECRADPALLASLAEAALINTPRRQ